MTPADDEIGENDARPFELEQAIAALTSGTCAYESLNYPRRKNVASLRSSNNTSFMIRVTSNWATFDSLGPVPIDLARRILAVITENK